MAITVTEKFGRILGDRSAELTFIVKGTGDDAAARTELLAHAPASHNGLDRDEVEVEEIGDQLWLGQVRYRKAGFSIIEFPATGDFDESFETGGGTQHLTQSISTVHKYPSSGAPDFQGAIGATDSGVEGVDVTVRVFNFTRTHYLEDSFVDAHRAAWYALTGRVNNASFKGYDAGELLLLGVSGGRRRGMDDWEITFRFAASPNRTNLSVGPLTGIDRKGWEYLWVLYEDAEDTGAKRLVKRPVAAYVEKVYEEGDFSLLGI
jgi:hypothetical protein